MRTRKEIEQASEWEWEEEPDSVIARRLDLILEVMLDLREKDASAPIHNVTVTGNVLTGEQIKCLLDETEERTNRL